jgi:predicted outer membrane repeat protein
MPRNRHASSRARPRLECLEAREVPATFTVTTAIDVVSATDGKLSLREAVTRANSHPGADTIVLPAGIFKIAIDGGNEDANATGDFDVTDSVRIQGAGAGLTVIDGQMKDRLFDVIGQFGVQFAGVTLRHGGGDVNGGAIQALNGNMRLANCVVSDNRGRIGGGISSEGGNVTLTGCTIARNVAGTNGGGISVGAGTVTLKGSVVRRNLATNGGGISGFTATLIGSTVSGNTASSIGGGLDARTVTLTRSTVIGNWAGLDAGGMNAADATLTNSTVGGNSAGAGDGGGFTCASVTLTNSVVNGNSAGGNGGGFLATNITLTNSTVSANTAGSSGGGVYAGSATVTGSRVTNNAARDAGGGIRAVSANVTNSTFSGNSADTGNGGGLIADEVVLTNCTVSGNSAGGNGGGICTFVGASIVNATIVENSALNSGGGVFRHPGASDPVFVQNSIIALNLVGFAGSGPDAAGSFVTRAHNLIGIVDGSIGFGDHGTDLFGSADRPLDPKLGPLAANGGPTKTHALLAGSPAIDAGDNANAPTTDQRGLARIKDGNGDRRAVIDIGAFER